MTNLSTKWALHDGPRMSGILVAMHAPGRVGLVYRKQCRTSQPLRKAWGICSTACRTPKHKEALHVSMHFAHRDISDEYAQNTRLKNMQGLLQTLQADSCWQDSHSGRFSPARGRGGACQFSMKLNFVYAKRLRRRCHVLLEGHLARQLHTQAEATIGRQQGPKHLLLHLQQLTTFTKRQAVGCPQLGQLQPADHPACPLSDNFGKASPATHAMMVQSGESRLAVEIADYFRHASGCKLAEGARYHKTKLVIEPRPSAGFAPEAAAVARPRRQLQLSCVAGRTTVVDGELCQDKGMTGSLRVLTASSQCCSSPDQWLGIRIPLQQRHAQKSLLFLEQTGCRPTTHASPAQGASPPTPFAPQYGTDNIFSRSLSATALAWGDQVAQAKEVRHFSPDAFLSRSW